MASPGVAPNAASGVDAFVLLLRFHEIAVNAAQIRHRVGTDSFGVPEILHRARGPRLTARAAVTDSARLAQTPLPALAECHDGSFIILRKIVDNEAILQDPRGGLG